MENNFDIHAQNYDTIFTHSVIGKAQRDQVYDYLSKELSIKNQLHVLELNCGTGEDAVYLHKKGHHVIATDISEEMIAVAKNKHQDITLNFGGLNCLSDVQLQAFLKTSEALLTDQGKLIMVIMPKHTLWERFYFLLKFQFKNAFRRNTTKAIYANVEGVQVPTWYYNPKDVHGFKSLSGQNMQTIF